jgi:oligopeptide transport system substrate-binding protein
VRLRSIDALAIESPVTALNLYLTSKVDWIPNLPTTVIPTLKAQQRDDFHPIQEFTTYFYRLNVTKPPLDQPLVRQALAMAIDKEEIVRAAARAGEVPAGSFVPPGVEGYEVAAAPKYDVRRARELLAKAGFPAGRGLPRITILYNNLETHQAIAELIQDQWKRNLGVRVDLQSQEWGAFLASTRQLRYTVSRAGWTGDYLDPNTFLDMFVTGGANNQTGWSSLQYDRLIDQAASEIDRQKRFELLRQAETILLDELPIIPIYFRVSQNMVRPYVKGFYENVQDVHPLSALWIERTAGNTPERRIAGLTEAGYRRRQSGLNEAGYRRKKLGE